MDWHQDRLSVCIKTGITGEALAILGITFVFQHAYLSVQWTVCKKAEKETQDVPGDRNVRFSGV